MSETTPLLTSPQPQSTNNKSRRSTWLCICGTAILLSILAMTASQHPSSSFITFDSRTTILISLDGVRAEYLKRGITPTLQAIASHGIHAPYMIPSFPTLTWPNHYTIVTGLYPSVHGIVGNLFRDKPTNLTFDYMDFTSQKQSFWWEAGEPIWCTSDGKMCLRESSCGRARLPRYVVLHLVSRESGIGEWIMWGELI
ncbi:alkaline-phosphatase-like protein [Obelidium mucronatum]|nr:alkaline-phosphatase-like protein [Obelidium mucronatum]